MESAIFANGHYLVIATIHYPKMQYMKFIQAFIIFLFVSPLGVYSESRTDSIRNSLNYQRENYAASQYRDVYKNFMQDYFGPGHILNDTTAAANYLRYELANSERFDGPDFEPTGFEGNFYRVNIRLIADGTVPYDTFFEAFVNSVQGIVPPDGDTWMKIWNEIDREISAIGWTFENEEQDRADLARQFSQGNYIAHHSRAFNQANNFHYRIISRNNFTTRILPLLQSKKLK